MSERRDVIRKLGIGRSTSYGNPIGVITESNFQTWKWRLYILAFLLNAAFVVASTLFDHFISWPWGAVIGIIFGILGFFPSFHIGTKVITKRTLE